jgi:hypothetical protein
MIDEMMTSASMKSNGLGYDGMMQPEITNSSAKIKHYVKNILQELPELSATADASDRVTQHFLNRLLVATDYASGCAVLAESNVGSAMFTITRALFESFISIYWAAQTKENGEIIVEASTREVIRIMKLNLEKGHARILHKETPEDHTRTLLRDPKMASPGRLPRYDHMADGAGIRKIYDQLYGMLSLLSHGSGADILANRDQAELIRSNLHSATASLRCIHLIVAARIKEDRVVRHSEIVAIMNVSLS